MDKATTVRAQAPARVNLLGEHTDYTGGYVLPMAIPFVTEATITPSPDGLRHFRSEQFGGEYTEEPGESRPRQGQWTDYPVGVLRELEGRGIHPQPFHMTLRGDVPLGSGLSSSASVEVATAYALLAYAGVTLPATEVALLCQRAENGYVGAPSGIMDQAISVLGQKDHALLLQTRTLGYELVPMDRGSVGESAVVICNSEVKHAIGTSDYGKRRKDAEEGQAAIAAAFPEATDLGHADEKQLEAVRGQVSANAYKRSRHILTENARVHRMRKALEAGDAKLAGELMLAGHASERDDFECSVPEVDFLVDTAAALPGCYGARLTGGGFGGCTVNLVRKDAVPAFTDSLRAAYRSRYGVEAPIFVCVPVDGAEKRAQAAAGRAS